MAKSNFFVTGDENIQMMDYDEIGEMLDTDISKEVLEVMELIPEVEFSTIERDAYAMYLEYHDIILLFFGKSSEHYIWNTVGTREKKFRKISNYSALCDMAEALREHGCKPYNFVSFYFEMWNYKKGVKVAQSLYRKGSINMKQYKGGVSGVSFPSLKAIVTDSLALLPSFLELCSTDYKQYKYLGRFGRQDQYFTITSEAIKSWCRARKTSDKEYWLDPTEWVVLFSKFPSEAMRPYHKRINQFRDEIEKVSGLTVEELFNLIWWLRDDPTLLRTENLRMQDLSKYRNEIVK